VEPDTVLDKTSCFVSGLQPAVCTVTLHSTYSY